MIARRAFVAGLLAVSAACSPALASNRFRMMRKGVGMAPAPLSVLYPGASWNGVAGSGYAGSPPAKSGAVVPGMDWISHMGATGTSISNGTSAAAAHFIFTDTVIPDGPFTGDVTLAVEAHDYGDDCTVTFHCEGNSLTVTEGERSLVALPSWGSTVNHRCFAATLKHSLFPSNGAIDVYAVVTSPRSGIADRVIGPLRLFRRTAPDRTISVGTGQATVAGVSYPTLQAALVYCQDNTADAWIKLQLTSDLTVDPGVTAFGTTASHSAARRGIIEVDPNGHSFTASRSSKGSWRPIINGLVFRGGVVDLTNIDTVYAEDGVGTSAGYRPMFFIGTEFHGAGQYEVFKDQTVRSAYILRANTALIGCYYHDCGGIGQRPVICTGTTFENTAGDILFVAGWAGTAAQGGSYCLIQNVAKNCSAEGYRSGADAWSFTYSGGGTATIELSGTHNTSARQAVAKVNGSIVGTFAASTTVGSGNYLVSDFVAAANAALGGSGWSFTTIDDARRFAASGAETGTDAYAAGSTIKAYFWLHADSMQLAAGVQHDNTLVIANQFLNCNVQFFPSPHTTTAAIYNTFMRNNILSLPSGDGTDSDLQAQISGQWHHACFDHNLMPNQILSLRLDQSSTLDANCSIMNNVYRKGTLLTGAGPDNSIKGNNHFFLSDTLGGTGDSIGGAATIEYPSLVSSPTVLATYSPAPGQALASNLKAPWVKFDRNGKRRAANDYAGAIAA